jgi:hypothetical protein
LPLNSTTTAPATIAAMPHTMPSLITIGQKSAKPAGGSGTTSGSRSRRSQAGSSPSVRPPPLISSLGVRFSTGNDAECANIGRI